MRVTATEVKEIIETTLSDAIVNAHIAGANALVNEVFGTGTSDLLKQIELWLTAHMLTLTRERQAAKEGAGGANIEYTGTFGQGLESTTFGQMVKVLDTTGAMASLGTKQASLFAITSFD